ncbi:10725_t:CDS:1, partial [Paraglomus brasilianum]
MATTLFNNQYRIDLPSTDTPTASMFVSLTPSEIGLLNHPPYILTISLDILLDPTYNRQSLPPRPQNAWIIFRRNFEGQLRAQHPTRLYTIRDVSKIASDQWKVQSDAVKEYFCVLSKLARERHWLAFPDYVYKPKRTKQRKRNEKFVFKNMGEAEFKNRQNNRMHTQRNIESNRSTVVINTDEHFVYENTYNDTWLEGSFQEDNDYD